ncbi:MAG TPA: FAD-dependent oxidoreductase [Ktedonobacteraceae bacterium]|nr:FAD-dependent oxidoreductase [Ktedonobacteraceae bacterium]
MSAEIQDLVIIGGGIMGLMTAYAAAPFSDKITIIEKSRTGDKRTASFGYTRSIRNDYLDPLYAKLAYEARRLWLELERKAAEPFIVNCGCLNIAKESVTPQLAGTYAEQSYHVLTSLHLKTEAFTRETLQQRFPQFDVDLGRLDVEAGFIYVPVVTRTLQNALQAQHVNILEEVEVVAIEQQQGHLVVSTNTGQVAAHKLVIAAGLGTNDILKRITGCDVQFPLQPDRPSQCKYYIPPPEKQAQFTAEALPVFAYLDVGIYGHPIYSDRTPGVKIGFYNPPDATIARTHIHDIVGFVEECMPALRDAAAVDVTEVDQCFYDLVADDNFILGPLPGFPGIAVGVGWRGTGYKYAPWVGRALMHLALQDGTIYDISRFSPNRFLPSQGTQRRSRT